MDAGSTDIHVLSTLGLGFFLGIKHAFDADHIIAVSTLTTERKGFWNSSLIGMVWGVGHTSSLLVVGLLVVLLGLQIPESVSQWMEFSVALMLIVLGVNTLWKLHRGAVLHAHDHEHGQHRHRHPHLHEHGLEEHTLPNHHPVKLGTKPFIVGVVHGLAGSAALMLLILTTISSKLLALIYIAVFGCGSLGGMFVMTAAMSVPFSIVSNHKRLNHHIRQSAGIISVVFGLFIAWQIAFLQGGLF